jgi:SAM-dependent methyltransferase
MPFEDSSFDVALTQAVLQSVDDKRAVFGEIARVLAPGGRYAFFDLVVGPGEGEFTFPVPWADGPEANFLVEATEIRALLADAGLEEVAWDSLAQIQARIGEAASGHRFMTTGHPQISLAAVMPDFEARMAGLAENVQTQRVSMIQGVFRAG